MDIKNEIKKDFVNSVEIYKDFESAIKKLKLNVKEKEILFKKIIEEERENTREPAGRTGSINDLSNINFIRNLRR
tara:strand:+ start:460 stop:684 length:225 start_codon:yes stop_codon:yes gene_type:complete